MKSSLVLTALALALVSATSLRAGAVLTIAPQTQTIAAGSAAQVQVRIAGLGLHTAPSLGAFDFDLSFNPALVAFTSLTFGDPVLGDQLDLSGTGSINSFGLQSAGLLEFFRDLFGSRIGSGLAAGKRFRSRDVEFSGSREGNHIARAESQLHQRLARNALERRLIAR